MQWTDLPLPRKTSHYWALLHDEFPKNNWGIATAEGISLFNLTSTPIVVHYIHLPLNI